MTWSHNGALAAKMLRDLIEESGGAKGGRDARQAVGSHSACGPVSRSRPGGSRGILGRLAKDFQYFPSYGALCPGMELHLHSDRHPNVAPLSRRSSRVPWCDWTTAAPDQVHCPRRPALCPFVRGYRSCRFPRLPVSPEGTQTRRLKTRSSRLDRMLVSDANEIGSAALDRFVAASAQDEPGRRPRTPHRGRQSCSRGTLPSCLVAPSAGSATPKQPPPPLSPPPCGCDRGQRHGKDQ